jgi:hypothetical protein
MIARSDRELSTRSRYWPVPPVECDVPIDVAIVAQRRPSVVFERPEIAGNLHWVAAIRVAQPQAGPAAHIRAHEEQVTCISRPQWALVAVVGVARQLAMAAAVTLDDP